jgi:hypothetical protein
MTTMKKGTLDLVNIVEMLGCPSEEVLGGSLEGHMVVMVTRSSQVEYHNMGSRLYGSWCVRVATWNIDGG